MLLSAAACLLLSLFAGCHSPVTQIPESPLPKVSFASGPRIRITGIGNREIIDPAVAAVGNFFVKHGGTLVNSNPQYFAVIYAESQNRIDQPAESQYNVVVRKVSRSDAAGGEEYITASKFTTSANAFSIAIVIYKVGSLEPIMYFDMPFYSGGTSGLLSPASAAQRFAEKLASSIVFAGKP